MPDFSLSFGSASGKADGTDTFADERRRGLWVGKLGGSLMDCFELSQRLSSWLASEPSSGVLIAGGGVWADAVRAADKRLELGDETAHWLAIDAMRLTARILHVLLPQAKYSDAWPIEADAVACNALTVLDPWAFLQADARGAFGDPLPRSWRVTSDSIAARLANVLGASRLVLIKSCDAPSDCDPQALAEAGVVDEYFPTAAAGLPLRWVNLRGSPSA